MALTQLVMIPLLLSACLAQSVTDLSTNQWTLQNLQLNISIPASVPSHAHLDLYANQVIGNPEYGLNDFNLRWIWQNNWTYTTTLTGLSNASQTFLLFQGLDTFCSIDLCGQHVATTNNQFRQYYFDVTHVLSTCLDPALSLNFGSAPSIVQAIANQPGQERWPYGVEIAFEIPNRQFMRKQQNDFGWDWGPAFAPAGPWQPAYIIQLNEAEIFIRNVLLDAYKLGQRSNLMPDQNQPWILNASLDYLGTLPGGASLFYTILDENGTSVMAGNFDDVNQTDSTITGSTSIPRDSVDLWWPVGMGQQTLYNITLSVHGSDNNTIASAQRRFGFRTIYSNKESVTAQQIVSGIAPGNNWHFEINGYPFYAKGSNFIPPDVFWPRVTPESLRVLLSSVVAGNQNMLRVWSSGAYSPDFMFDIADELGILLWTEFEFGDALYPVDQAFLDNVYEEAVYQVRRVNHHPSLAYWAGGNELENLELQTIMAYAPDQYSRFVHEYEELFLSTLFPAIFENSRSISYAPSSTSNGFTSLNFTEAPYIQERYQDVEPNHFYGDTDYYNYDSSVAFDTSEYPIGRFSNEFGFHSMPSLQTWQAYVPENQLFFNSNTIIYRNRHYPPGGLNITNYLNTSKGMAEMTLATERWYPIPDKTDSVANFSAWCWTTQVFQADYYGSQIQFYRRGSGLPQRTLGSLYWQLEDQWAAPTWAGIERSGRWKVLHYRARDLYQNVIVSPFWNASTGVLEAWVTSDLWSAADGMVSLKFYYWNGSTVANVTGMSSRQFNVGALNSTRVYQQNVTQQLKDAGVDARDIVASMNITVTGRLPNSGSNMTFEHTNWWHAAPLSSARLVDPGLKVSFGNGSVEVTAQDGVSAWTWLDTPPGALVYFEDNGFWLGKDQTKAVSYNVSNGTTFNGRDVTVYSLWNNTLKI